MDRARGARADDLGGGVPPTAVRDQVNRILASPTFSTAPTLSRLLRHLTEGSLAGTDGQLKEYAIGVELLGRGASFDPQLDTIVRVHARRLRRRLDEYYATVGRSDPIRLELPKGHYVVRWRINDLPALRAPAAGRPSIVVLPFVDFSGDGRPEYFADGLTDEIIGALASQPDLQVVARTSAFQFKGRSDDIRTIGTALGVQLALEGSVRREAQALRVLVQLIDVSTGFPRWSCAYDRDLTGLFRMQDEVAQSIVQSVRDRLGLAPASTQPAAPVSADAHDCYLKGRYFWNRATPADVASSIRYFEQAIAHDPAYAAAHAGLADAYVFLATIEMEAPGPLMQAARRAAQAALDLRDVAEGHSAMGAVLGIGDWDWAGAEREFRRALELKPSFAHARGAYAVGCLAPLRRHDEAIEQLRQAIRLDPLSVFLRTLLGQSLILAGAPDAAVKELEHALELDPGYAAAALALAWAQIGRSDLPVALQVLEAAAPPISTLPNWAGHAGFVYAGLGRPERARSVLQTLLDRFPGPWVPAVDVAAIHTGLGDTGAAFEWLQRARDLRSFDVAFVRDDPRFGTLRGHPRLVALMPDWPAS